MWDAFFPNRASHDGKKRTFQRNMFNAIVNFFTRSFYNLRYGIFRPEIVEYWKHNDTAKAKVITLKDGSYGMKIDGEKRTYPGFPIGSKLTGPLAGLKNKLKNIVFNQAFAEMEKYMADHRHEVPPIEKMPPAVRHIWETFEKLEDCEIVPDMRARITLIKKVLTHFLDSDDAYRFRSQLFLELIDQKKIRLSKEDLYYAGGKYWKPLRYKKMLGRVVDAYEY